MDPVIPQKPQSANDYDDRTARAVKSVLVEIGQILGSFRGKFAVIGGQCRGFSWKTLTIPMSGHWMWISAWTQKRSRTVNMQIWSTN